MKKALQLAEEFAELGKISLKIQINQTKILVLARELIAQKKIIEKNLPNQHLFSKYNRLSKVNQ